MTCMFNRVVYLLIALFLFGFGLNIANGYTWYSRIDAITYSYGEYKEIVGILIGLCGLPFLYWAIFSRKSEADKSEEKNNIE